jgi:hypothetical protein
VLKQRNYVWSSERRVDCSENVANVIDVLMKETLREGIHSNPL